MMEYKSYLQLRLICDMLETHTLAELKIPAMQEQSQKAKIFRISERHITNQKMIDNWGNAKTALPRQR